MREMQFMTTEATFRWVFLILLVALLAMQVYFMIKCTAQRDRSCRMKVQSNAKVDHVYSSFVFAFLALMTFLVMYFLGMPWIDGFSFALSYGLCWVGLFTGIVTVIL